MSLNEENTQWRDDYCIGDKEIDREYKKLFTIARKALELNNANSDEEIISIVKQVIDELSFYVSTHFVLEQKYMQDIQYTNYTAHTQTHQNIVANLNKFISHLNDLSLEEVKAKLFDLIKTDFIDHIVIEDQKIVQWENSLDSFKKTFDWMNCFELKELTIDNSNKKLFIMAQEAFHQANEKQIDEKLRLIIKYIYNYLKEHFRYEEALMHEVDYPKLPQHLLMHRKIISQINHYVEHLPNMDNKHDFEKGLATLIENTLIFHVMDEDEHFRQWYKENILVWS